MFCPQLFYCSACYRRTCWVSPSCVEGRATEGSWAPEADADGDCQSAVHVPYTIWLRDCHSNAAESCDMRRVVSTDGNKWLNVD
jgi:hypothetical protein